jgi:predicted O-methyltransferase YrrM
MNHFWLIKEYIKWYLSAKNLHGIHSPFVYEFIKNCINADIKEPVFQEIESLRKEYKNNSDFLSYADPGAGNRIKTGNVKNKRKIQSIAKNSLQHPRYCRLFYRMINYLEVFNVLELGTSLGITTSYMSRAGTSVKIDTIEGVKEIAALASGTFSKLNCQNISLHIGTFDEILPSLFPGEKQFQMVFIDGDHKGSSLLKYFDCIVKQIPRHGVVIIDDIRWSHSMYDAWEVIKNHPEVTVTIDLFYMGLVFFRPGLSKENFMIKF